MIKNYRKFHDDFHGFEDKYSEFSPNDGLEVLYNHKEETKTNYIYNAFSSKAFILYYPDDDGGSKGFIDFCLKYQNYENLKKSLNPYLNNLSLNWRVMDLMIKNDSSISTLKYESQLTIQELLLDFFANARRGSAVFEKYKTADSIRYPALFRAIKLNEFLAHSDDIESFESYLESNYDSVDQKCKDFEFVNYGNTSEYLLNNMNLFNFYMVNSSERSFEDSVAEEFYRLNQKEMYNALYYSKSIYDSANSYSEILEYDKSLHFRVQAGLEELALEDEMAFRLEAIEKDLKQKYVNSRDFSKPYEPIDIYIENSDLDYLLLNKIYRETSLNSLDSDKQLSFYNAFNRSSRDSNFKKFFVKVYKESDSIDYELLLNLMIESNSHKTILDLEEFLKYDSSDWRDTPISWHYAQLQKELNKEVEH